MPNKDLRKFDPAMRSFSILWLCALVMAPFAWGSQPIASKDRPTIIRSISLETLPDADLIVVKADGPIDRWNHFSFKDPGEIIVLDLYDCAYTSKLIPDTANGRFIRLLRFGRHPGKIRIAANLEGPTDLRLQLHETNDGMALYIGRPDSAENFTSTPSSRAHKVEIASTAPSPQQSKDLWEGSENPGKWSLQGKIWNKFAHDVREDNRFEDDMANHFKFRLGARYAPYDHLYAVLSVDFDHFGYYNDGDWNTDEDVRFYESYINYSDSRFNVRAGNQIVRWGKTDGYSPLDNVNPEDLRDGFAGRREERKLAVPMVNFEWYQGTYALQGILIPYFVPSEFDLFGTDWALFDHLRKEIGPFSVEEEEVSKGFENIEYGARFSGTAHHIDYAFSYLHARTDIPTLIASGVPLGFPVRFSSAEIRELARFALLTGETIDLQYDSQNILGFEFETTMRDFGLRGDFAYVYRGSFLKSDLSRVKKPLFQYMIGADYDGPRNSYFLLQFSQSIIQDYDEDIITSDRIINAVNGTVSKEFLHGKLKPEFRFFYDVINGTYLINPKLLIRYWDFFHLEVGAEFFGGPKDSLLGLYTGNDQIYTVLKIAF